MPKPLVYTEAYIAEMIEQERKRAAEVKVKRQETARKNLAKYWGKPPKRDPNAPKPVSSRNRLQGNFLRALADDFEKHGKGALEVARRVDPMGYIKTIATLMPKQFEQTSPLEDMSDSELAAGIAILRSQLSVNTVDEGTGAAEVSEPLN
jgi:hypothetical protein